MKTITGGKVVASGGFGCVFEPALKCKGAKKRTSGKISKLMTTKHAIEEYEEITNIKNKLDTIKNYEDYFLLQDIELCSPAKLTQTDLTAFNKKCTALKKKNITRNNINENIADMMTLNMPNGGEPIDDFIVRTPTIESVLVIHNELIELLKNGIIPMNKKHVYHCDIKDSNVLVKQTASKLKARLIDWGLSTTYTPFTADPFPKTWRNRPLQFNVPFSVIIFSEYFIDKYTKYMDDGGGVDAEELKPFVLEFVISWMKERGAGHYKFINEILFSLYSHSFKYIPKDKLNDVIETQITMNYIVNYIVDVLVHFTRFRDDGKLCLREYLDNVFIEIVDIWGFISVYFPVVDMLSNNYDTLTPDELRIFESLKYIFHEYLYKPRHERVDMKMLYVDLKNLGDLISFVVSGKKQTTPNTDNSTINRLMSSNKNSLASGIKTRKKRLFHNKRRFKTFKHNKRPKRFKNPVYLQNLSSGRQKTIKNNK